MVLLTGPATDAFEDAVRKLGQIELDLSDYIDKIKFSSEGHRSMKVEVDRLQSTRVGGEQAQFVDFRMNHNSRELVGKEIYVASGKHLYFIYFLGDPDHIGIIDEVARSLEFGDSYSETLRRWHVVFNERWAEIEKLGFDDRFRRMWNFYLTSCAACFKSGTTDVTQISMMRPA